MVELLVRETPCRDHPEEEWLTLKEDGVVILSICTGALKSYASSFRGRDMIQLPRATAPPDTPSDPRDLGAMWSETWSSLRCWVGSIASRVDDLERAEEARKTRRPLLPPPPKRHQGSGHDDTYSHSIDPDV